VILDYVRALEEGAHFPPVTAFDVPDRGLILADGFHRLEAYKHHKRSEILTDVREGSWLEAFRFAREYNMRHGYKLTRAEVQKAIRDYLKHPELGVMSDRDIGRHLGVDNKTVAAQRRVLDTGSGESSSPGRVFGRRESNRQIIIRLQEEIAMLRKRRGAGLMPSATAEQVLDALIAAHATDFMRRLHVLIGKHLDAEKRQNKLEAEIATKAKRMKG
jgi:hypothetical protein